MNEFYQKRYVEERLTNHFTKEVLINQVRSVHGGDINAAYQLFTNHGTYFLKMNSSTKYPGMFEQESNGLQVISATNSLRVPEVILFDEGAEDSFLLLEWIEQESPSVNFWGDFGRKLAQMHRISREKFGWSSDNYIGTLKQQNTWNSSWFDFFVEQRLEAQLKLGIEQGKIQGKLNRLFEKLFPKLEGMLPRERTALVHGDLWSGNFMVAKNGQPMVMDPAAYYGHREVDLAMTKLFGGFSEEMYHAYNEFYPLESGWEERVDLYNLYPLLVHVNLFGGGYVDQVERICMRFL